MELMWHNMSDKFDSEAKASGQLSRNICHQLQSFKKGTWMAGEAKNAGLWSKI